MSPSLLKKIVKYKKYSKEYIDTLGFATKYLDTIENDFELKERRVSHIQTGAEAKLKKQTDKTLKMIKKALEILDTQKSAL